MDAEGRRYIKFMARVDSLPTLKKEIIIVELFQNQRREENKWHQKYLYDIPAFSCADGSFSCTRFPKNLAPPTGYVWLDRWRPCLKQPTRCDENGWTYGSTFAQITDGTNTSSTARDKDRVRRRRWIRTLESSYMQFKWKDERLGVSLVEPPNLDFQKCVQVDSRVPLPIQLLPVGATQSAVVKHASREDLQVHALLTKGDLLLRVNDTDVAHIPFHEMISTLEKEFAISPRCTLWFAASSGCILIQSCTRAASKCQLRPGFRLVGLNGRSIKHMRLVDVESLLRMAPRNSCTLDFQAMGEMEPPYFLISRTLLGVKEGSKAPPVAIPSTDSEKWKIGSHISALFAWSG